MKRWFDLVVSLTALVVLMPVIVTLCLLVAIKLGRPILFKQIRPGLHGKPFYLLKFRSMTDARDASGELKPDSERLSSFGQKLRSTSVDELPSLLNVLKGDLSLVGPRPLLMDYLPLYSTEQSRRHEVKPGITGWAQVNGRNALSWDEKFALDVWYVENRTFWLDIKILFMTINKVFKRDGINQAGEATMTRFTGSQNHD
nr:sugar transferase [Alteromonas oceanisediminis]